MLPLFLWIHEIRIHSQMGVRKVEKMATVIGHGINGTRDIERCEKVAVMMLMEHAES